jgi:hypothetical protein
MLLAVVEVEQVEVVEEQEGVGVAEALHNP